MRESKTMIDETNKAKIAIQLVDGTMIKGMMNIHKYNRVTDFLNSKDSDQFLIIYDASMTGLTGNVVIINRDQIVWAIPEE
jgi:hypothetical protein